MILYCAEKKTSGIAKVFLLSVGIAGHAKTCVFSLCLLTLRMFANSVNNREEKPAGRTIAQAFQNRVKAPGAEEGMSTL